MRHLYEDPWRGRRNAFRPDHAPNPASHGFATCQRTSRPTPDPSPEHSADCSCRRPSHYTRPSLPWICRHSMNTALSSARRPVSTEHSGAPIHSDSSARAGSFRKCGAKNRAPRGFCNWQAAWPIHTGRIPGNRSTRRWPDVYDLQIDRGLWQQPGFSCAATAASNDAMRSIVIETGRQYRADTIGPLSWPTTSCKRSGATCETIRSLRRSPMTPGSPTSSVFSPSVCAEPAPRVDMPAARCRNDRPFAWTVGACRHRASSARDILLQRLSSPGPDCANTNTEADNSTPIAAILRIEELFTGS